MKIFKSIRKKCRRGAKVSLKIAKFAFYTAAALALIIGALLMFADAAIKFAINNSAEYIDLRASVGDVDLNLFTQRLTLKNITLKNPDGFPEGNAFEAAQLSVKFDVFDTAKPLKRVYMRGAKIRVEGRTGRRILAGSITRSNVYIIAREIGRTFDKKIERVFFARKKPKESAAQNEFDYAQIRSFLERYQGLDEIRIEDLKIENGGDSCAFASIVCNDKIAFATGFRASIFGVKGGIRNMFFDLSRPRLWIANLYIKNPEGFQKNNAFEIGRIMVATRDEVSAEGKITPRIESIAIDSPTVYFEDKDGSMLGAIGMDNNFSGLFKTVDSMTRVKLQDYFQDEFEVVPETQEFKFPEIKLENLRIANARIISTKKDAGLLANKITFAKNKIDIDDIRAHFGGLKLELAGVNLDAEKQTFRARDFMLKNPAGFPEESAFRFKNFAMTTNFTERVIRGNRVLEVGEMEVDKFFVRLDSRSGDLIDLIGNDNNLYAVLNTVAATSAKMPINSANAEKQINADKTKRPYRYTVKAVRFLNGIILIGPRGEAIKIPFKDIKKENLGVKEKGLTAQELTNAILLDIISNSLEGAESRVSREIGGVVLAPIISVLRFIITTF